MFLDYKVNLYYYISLCASFISLNNVVTDSSSTKGPYVCGRSLITHTTSSSITIDVSNINMTDVTSSYIIMYRSTQTGRLEIMSNTLNRTSTSYTYSPLIAGSVYTFNVYINQSDTKHIGPPTCSVQQRTKPMNPNCSLVNVTEVTNSSFTLNLNEVDIGAYYFKIRQHSLTDGSISREMLISLSDGASIISNLLPGEIYTFYLQGIGKDNQTSDKTCSFQVVTKPNDPQCNLAIFSEIEPTKLSLFTNQRYPDGSVGYLLDIRTIGSHIKSRVINGEPILTLQNLDPGVTYTVTLYSVGRNGKKSDGFCKFQQSTCSSMPFKDFTVQPINSSAVVLSFSIPKLKNKTNIPFKLETTYQHHVCISNIDDSNYVTTTTEIHAFHKNGSDSNQISYILSQLYSNWLYFIRVKPVICDGLGSLWSIPQVGRTKEAAPGNINFTSVRFKNITAHGVIISWNIPCYPNADETSYEIELANFKNYITDGGETNITISDLEQNTRYQVSVMAFNSVGNGPRTRRKSFRTLAETPGKVKNFKVLMHNFSATFPYILISWEPPKNEEPQCKIRCYHVVYWLNTSPGEKIYRNTTTNNNVYLKVNNKELYTIQVFAEALLNGSKVETSVYVREDDRYYNTNSPLQTQTDLLTVEILCGVLGSGILLVLIALTVVCARQRRTGPTGLPNNKLQIQRSPTYEKIKDGTRKRVYDVMSNEQLEDSGMHHYFILEQQNITRENNLSTSKLSEHDYIYLEQQHTSSMNASSSDYDFVNTAQI